MASKGMGKFLRVKCLDCDNEQIVFNRAASTVQCIICGKTIVKPKGGKSEVKTRVVEVVR